MELHYLVLALAPFLCILILVVSQLWLQNIDEKKYAEFTKSNMASKIYKLVSVSAMLSAIMTVFFALSQSYTQQGQRYTQENIFHAGGGEKSNNERNYHVKVVNEKFELENNENDENDENDENNEKVGNETKKFGNENENQNDEEFGNKTEKFGQYEKCQSEINIVNNGNRKFYTTEKAPF